MYDHFLDRLIIYLKLVSLRACSVAQSCPTLCEPMDWMKPLGSSVHGIFQARILEWLSISYSMMAALLLPNWNVHFYTWGSMYSILWWSGISQSCFDHWHSIFCNRDFTWQGWKPYTSDKRPTFYRLRKKHLRLKTMNICFCYSSPWGYYGNNLKKNKHITARDAQSYTDWAEETQQILYTVKRTRDVRWMAHLFCPSSQNYLCSK